MASPSGAGDLYALPLDEFTAARNELAKKLKADGDAAAAAKVKALKKPSRPAWLVNALARDEADGVGELLAAGEKLRSLQEKMIAGDADAGDLRDAAAREQRVVDGLLKAAKKLDPGAASGVIDRVGETLQAAASDPELADAIREGRVEKERRASSLGLVGAAGTAPRARSRKKEKGKGKEAPPAAEAEERSAAEKRALAKEHRRAKRELGSADRAVEHARVAAEHAQAELESRREQLAEAEAERDRARSALAEVEGKMEG